MTANRKIEIENLIENTIYPYPVTQLIKEAIKVFLKGVFESLIIINKNGAIEYMDGYAEKFFSKERGGAKGLHITNLMPESRLHIVAGSGIKETAKIQKVKGEDKIVTRYPIKKDGDIIGAVGKIIFQKLEEIENLNKEISRLKQKLETYKYGFKDLFSSKYTFEDITGNNEKFIEIKEMARKVASTDASILLMGESGTGKELFAHSIHSLSNRKNRPFIRVNCAAIPFDLAESELFGYERGAFSGAKNEGKPGKFELAKGGTVFLDEIGSLPFGLQSKLLRVLEEKEVERLGGKRPIKLDFRLLSATNSNLQNLIDQERFRPDLFYRLSSVPIQIPPLRERKEDIILYLEHFLKNIATKMDIEVNEISNEAIPILVNYKWPGNIRELINVLEQSVLKVTKGVKILPEHLPSFLFANNYTIYKNGFGLKKSIEETEKLAIQHALKYTNGNKRKAAKLLGIQRSVLYNKINKYEIN